ncbi:hypothetical protein K2173_003528 [Erythroxylum novogranatense]|uniref:GIR1-like zinc ribbon domain-containing protein n=1 Tax=Erythroxylum novogranatense TaxID=1862640 RepID=A0AAV8TAE1_9ROSI|nr:hypothetical protein K2173_003528 [Erythroxylum novogranatense]
MAADVKSMVNSGNSEILVTRDLLGELSKVLVHKDLQEPSPDVKSKECWSSSLASINNTKRHDHHVMLRTSQLQNRKLSYFNAKFLELKLQVPSTNTSNHLQSVCTLDKVKSALQRADKHSYLKKRSSSSPPPPSSDYKQEEGEGEEGSEGDGNKSMFAAGCPVCLMYVMALKNNPKCPRCNAIIPSPLLLAKKPRFDLNASL